MRSLLVALIAGLALAPTAQAKTGWEADRDWQSLAPGQKAKVLLTAIDHASGGPPSRFEGVVPTLQFERLSSGDLYESRGTPADSRGRSIVAVTVPRGGVFRISVLVRERIVGGWPLVEIKGPVKPAAAPSPADEGGGPSPALLIAAAVAVLLVTTAVMTRRRPRMGGA